MSMRWSLAFIFVIGVTTAALSQSDKATADFVTDREAHRIYTTVVPNLWARQSKDPIVLQRETEDAPRIFSCQSFVPHQDPEWVEIRKRFWDENARRRLLPPDMPIGQPYRLISLQDIEADDARLALKYPGIYNERPESLQYAAVSAVGFNANKTKAMVYVRLRSNGELLGLERRDGKWTTAANSRVCAWIA